MTRQEYERQSNKKPSRCLESFQSRVKAIAMGEDSHRSTNAYEADRERLATLFPWAVLNNGEFMVVPLRKTDWTVVKQVAAWEADAFGGRQVDEREQQYRRAFEALDSGRTDPSAWGILEAFVALDVVSGKALGSVSLVSHDMAWFKSNGVVDGVSLQTLTPWLASLYVNPSARRQGLGKHMVECVVAEASRRGFTQVFLFCCPDMVKLNLWYGTRGFENWGEKLQGGFRVMHRSIE